jgi:hypothetical protein
VDYGASGLFLDIDYVQKNQIETKSLSAPILVAAPCSLWFQDVLVRYWWLSWSALSSAYFISDQGYPFILDTVKINLGLDLDIHFNLLKVYGQVNTGLHSLLGSALFPGNWSSCHSFLPTMHPCYASTLSFPSSNPCAYLHHFLVPTERHTFPLPVTTSQCFTSRRCYCHQTPIRDAFSFGEPLSI